MNTTVVTLFPLWALGSAAIGFFKPEILLPLSWLIMPLLGVVMLGMGLTLLPRDFLDVAKTPLPILAGSVLQYLLMPFLGWAYATLLGLPLELAAGLVLTGSCPGGTASNVITYLARGNVPLSISLTAISTMLAVVATPALTWAFIGREVPVPVMEMVISILEVVLIPVAAGVYLNSKYGAGLQKFAGYFPVISVVSIALIIGIIVSANSARISGGEYISAALLAVALHNLSGMTAGYYLSRLIRLSQRDARTIAVEVGMQNSGLAVALAMKHLSAMAAIPGAIFSVWHNLSGSAFAAYCGKYPPDSDK